MVRRRRKKRDVMFLIAAALIIAFIWGAFEFGGDGGEGEEVNPDSDADGLPDAWETTHFGNLDQGAGDDPDGDGLTNLEEYNADSDPTVAPEPEPENLTFSVYIRNFPNDHKFNVTFSVDEEELFNITMDTTMRQADDTYTRLEGNHTFKITAINLTSDNATYFDDTLELKDTAKKLYIDIYSDRLEVYFSDQILETPPACGV